jgi:hypothetical protein
MDLRRAGHAPTSRLPARALRVAIATLLAAIALGSASAPEPARAAPGCTRVAAPAGSDGAAGTVTAPFATFNKLAHSLRPGQVGCLRAGTYRENVEVNA